MKQLHRVGRLALFLSLALAVGSTAKAAPPNWKVSATGTSTLADFDGTYRTDVDAFSGHSSHLGNFTATGYHVLNIHTGQFAGVATYTAANGDTMNLTYVGQLSFSVDPDFPFDIISDIEIHGGTGRFANATGGGVMTGGFTGEVPVGEFYIDIEGTLKK